jgi:TonB family protein
MKGIESDWCYATQFILIMKFRHLSFVALGAVLLTAGVAAPAGAPGYVPMKVIQTEPVIYPRRATEIGVTSGEVHVSVQVDEKGKLTDHLVTAYSHPLLAESAVQAIKKWDYEPAWVAGEPRSATIDLSFQFENRGMVVVDLNVSSYVQLRDIQLRPGAYRYGVKTLRQLDRIPTPTKVVQPLYPAEAAQKQQSAVITVNFFIDEKGRVRLPAVSRETSENYAEFSAAAVNAVTEWEFEPPLSKGQPVLVAARQDFNFKPVVPADAK